MSKRSRNDDNENEQVKVYWKQIYSSFLLLTIC